MQTRPAAKFVALLTLICLTAIAFMASAGHAAASTITWGAATPIFGNSDISTAGTYVNAINFGSSNLLDDSGDTFYHVQTSATGGTPSLLASQNGLATDPITVTIDNINYGANPANSNLTGDANYDAILANLGYDNGTKLSESSTVTLNGLTLSDRYQVEVWASQPSNATAGNSATIAGGPDLQTAGYFALGTFTADATLSQSFTFSSAENPIINAIELRALPAPEPSSLILLGFGAAGLLVSMRCCRKT